MCSHGRFYCLNFLLLAVFIFYLVVDMNRRSNNQLSINIEATIPRVWKWWRLQFSAGFCDYANNASSSNQFGWEVQAVSRYIFDSLVSYEQHSLYGQICSQVMHAISLSCWNLKKLCAWGAYLILLCRSEAKDLLGDDWVQRHRRIVQQHANQYKRVAWAKVWFLLYH